MITLLAVIGYPNYWLSRVIASKLKAVEIGVYDKVFPDGELYVKLIDPEKIALNKVVIVSTLYPEQEDRLFKTLLLIDAARNSNPSKIIALIPYLAYSRQDKIFLPGEPISACLVLRFLKTAGVDVLLTVDVHSSRVLKCFDGEFVNIMVSDVLVKHALRYLNDPVIIAPDKGAVERARLPAEIHGLDYDYLEKHRDRVTGEVTYTPREIDVVGRDIIIVDDIISTGGTIAESSKILLKKGANRVIVTASHGLLVGEAIKKLESSGVLKVILADTLGIRHAHKLVEYVDITDKLIEELNRVISW